MEGAVSVGEGSTQIRPNHSLEVQLEVVDATVLEGTELKDGFGVAEFVDVVVVVGGSSQPPNQPGVAQLEVEVEVDEVVDVEAVVGSSQPNQPGVSQVVVEVEVEVEVKVEVEVLVVVGTGKMLLEVVMTV